jgi:type I restriction enzyme S subunit
MNAERLLALFEPVSEAPDAIPRLRRFILDLAVRGKLVEQDPEDEPGGELLRQIEARFKRLRITKRQASLGANEIPFALPDRWEWIRLGQICEKTGSGSTPRGGKEAYSETGIPFLRSQNIYNDGLRLADVVFIDDQTHQRMEGTRVRPCDLLLNITGGSIGRCARVPVDFQEANISQHVAIIRVGMPGMEDFIHVLILSPYFQSFVDKSQTGAGRGGLPKNRMDAIPAPLPPLTEQHRIVAKVDELMALCDQLEAARMQREQYRERLVAASLQRLNQPSEDLESFRSDARFALQVLPRLTTTPAQIKQLRQTILNLAVRGKLVEQDPEELSEASYRSLLSFAIACEWIPETWLYAPLASLLRESSRNGYSRKPDDAEDGTPILRISAGTSRADGLVAEEDFKLISGIDESLMAQYELIPGDLLACRFNGNKSFVGRLSLFAGYLGRRFIYPDKLIRIRLSEELADPTYIRWISASDLLRSEIESKCATTVGNWGISAGRLKTCFFPLPPVAEQHRIVAKIDELMALCDQLEQQLTKGEESRRGLLEAVLQEVLAELTSQLQPALLDSIIRPLNC